MMVNAFINDTQFAIERLPHFFKLINLNGKFIRPYIQIQSENATYEIKTVNGPEELIQVLRLRFEVFFREFSTRKVRFSLFPYDVDRLDFICDHLVVKNKETGSIVACYRLLPSQLKEKFNYYYTESEFNLDEFLSLPGNKLELGRACVHKDYRNGEVISLLWKGLCEYARLANVRYMFGCSSINRKDFNSLDSIMNYVGKKNAFIEDFNVSVKEEFLSKVSDLVGEQRSDEESSGIGSLMHMYLMAGAKMGKELAYDEEMDCLDMFTLVDFSQLPPSFRRRFSF